MTIIDQRTVLEDDGDGVVASLPVLPLTWQRTVLEDNGDGVVASLFLNKRVTN
jgi:hypothetical protein